MATESDNNAISSSDNDTTLVSEVNPRDAEVAIIKDWSQTGRGSHVEFQDDEVVPLEQGLFLGRGAAGDVYKVDVQGWKLAHKRMVVKRKLDGKEKTEIDILKRLPSHYHIIQLVGTYTHRHLLGILLYPVAVCDLHTFFEDVEAWHHTANGSRTPETRLEVLNTTSKNCLVALGYDFPPANRPYNASLVYSKVGCLISAISYLHDQKIRHKDLKPSNILLSKDRLWLSDFGSATDFSLLSQSATDNERGTPRYFSPEVAAWKPNGRAADIFSLGCILLEVLVLHDQGTLHHMRQNRSADPSFHANLNSVNTWLTGPVPRPWSARRVHLVQEIKSMLTRDPALRPTAKQLLVRVTGYDLAHESTSGYSLFSDCCKSQFIRAQDYERAIAVYKSSITDLQSNLERVCLELDYSHTENRSIVQDRNLLRQRYTKEHQHRVDFEAAKSRELSDLQKELDKSQYESNYLKQFLLKQKYQFEQKARELQDSFGLEEYDRKELWQTERNDLLDQIAKLQGELKLENSNTPSLSTPKYNEMNRPEAVSKTSHTSRKPLKMGPSSSSADQRRESKVTASQNSSELSDAHRSGVQPTESQSRGPNVKPAYLKGLSSVSTTSSKPLPYIQEDIIRVLDKLGIQWEVIKGGFSCRYISKFGAGDGLYELMPQYRLPEAADESSAHVQNGAGRKMLLSFEVLIVKVPLFSLYGIQFKKVEGGTWQYKDMAQTILSELRL